MVHPSPSLTLHAPTFTPFDRPSSPVSAPLLIGSVKSKLREGTKNILITGGAGFIGSWVTRHLVVQHPEYNIVCFDKLDYCATLNNLGTVHNQPNFTFHHGDITEPDSINGALFKHQIDTILHFAAQSHVDLSFGNSFGFTHVNVFGTHVLLEAAKAADVKLFLHISTDEVYGEVASDAADLLETSLLAPTNPYAASKAAAEMLVNAYYKSFKLPVIMIRANNVYGPNQYPEKIIPKFCCLLNRNRKLIIHGDGSPTRRYLYGSDAADAIDIVLSKGIVGQIYNIASEDEVSNMQVCRKLLSHYGKGEELDVNELKDCVDFVRDRPFNDHRYAVDGTKIKALGFRQRVTFEQGLRNTIQWYQQFGETWWGDISAVLSPFPVKIVNEATGQAHLRPNTPLLPPLTPPMSRSNSYA